MICLHCGYCCCNYLVVIIKDPSKPFGENNLEVHNGLNTPCKYLTGDKPGEYMCSVHHYPWYKETPCFSHSQIEHKNSPCRIGGYILKKNNQNDK